MHLDVKKKLGRIRSTNIASLAVAALGGAMGHGQDMVHGAILMPRAWQ